MATDSDGRDDYWLNKFHSFNKLIRVIETALRWTPTNLSNRTSPLSAKELNSASIKVLQFDQSINFPKELSDLRKSIPILKGSKIASLKLFLDQNGLLRVGNRIEECPYLTLSEKFPIILG